MEKERDLEINETNVNTRAMLEKLKEENIKLNDQLNRSNGKGIQLKQAYMDMKAEIDSDDKMFEWLPDELKREYATMQYQLKLAAKYIRAEAFPSLKTPEQALVIMRAGRELGMSDIEALNSLYMVKGSIEFYGKALTARFLDMGYRPSYLNETTDAVLVRVTSIENEQEFYEEWSKKSDKSLEKSNAIKFAPFEKLRYHGLRKIAKFHLANHFKSVGVGDEKIDFETIETRRTEQSPKSISAPNVDFDLDDVSQDEELSLDEQMDTLHYEESAKYDETYNGGTKEIHEVSVNDLAIKKEF